MPVPTDTFWNIRRLNQLFALSAVALVGVVVWTIVQDYFQEWRQPQRNAQVWEAALVREKIERVPVTQEQLDAIDEAIARKQDQIERGDEEYKKNAAAMRQ